MSRSPNSCESSFRYGVSRIRRTPGELEQGLEKLGARTVAKSTRARSAPGNCSKKAMLSRSTAPGLAVGWRLIALCRGTLPPETGQASTQSRQPVQSSAYTCNVYAGVGRARALSCSGAEGGGRPAQLRRRVVDRDRITAVRAHRSVQLPHWMQRSGSQLGHPLGDVALLVGGRAARVRAVDGQGAHRELITAAGHHRSR